MISKEQAEKIKKQILKQADSWQVSEEQRAQAKEQIQAMTEEELEVFLSKNNLIKGGEKGESCVFCLIAEGKIQSYKIAENSDSIAVLEINPLSTGHTLIIPKKHLQLESFPISVFSLALDIIKKIKQELKPKTFNISNSNFSGHEIISILPVYGNETGKRKKAEEKELQELQKKLAFKQETEARIEKTKTSPEKLEKAPKRKP